MKRQSLPRKCNDRTENSGSAAATTRTTAWGVFDAIKLGNLDKVKRIISSHGDNFNVNMQEVDGWTPLLAACGRGNTEVASFLVGLPGCDIEARNNLGETALVKAAHGGKLEVVRVLIGAGADVNALDDIGMSALLLAASEGHLEITRSLLDAGASINVKDDYGRTAIDCALENNYFDLTKLLALSGGDPTHRSRLSRPYKSLCWEINLLRGLICLEDMGVYLGAVEIEDLYCSCDASLKKYFNYNPASLSDNDSGSEDDNSDNSDIDNGSGSDDFSSDGVIDDDDDDDDEHSDDYDDNDE